MAVTGRPLKFQSVKELQDAIDLYFLNCTDPEDENKYIRPLTITGLANALDTSRETLLEYEDRPEFVDTIKRAKGKIHQYVEEYLFNGKNQTSAIFNLKNNYGWKDKTEQDINNPDGNLKTIIIQKTNE